MSSRSLGCKDRRGHGSTRRALATPGRGTPWWLLVSGYDPGRVAQVGRLRNFLLHPPLCGRGRAGARGWGRLAVPASDGRHVRAAATAKRLMASAAFACLRHSRCLRATLAMDDLRERCGTNADCRIRCGEQACGTALRVLLPLVCRGRLIVDCETLVSRSNAGAGCARCLRPGTDDPSPTDAGARRLAGTDAP